MFVSFKQGFWWMDVKKAWRFDESRLWVLWYCGVCCNIDLCRTSFFPSQLFWWTISHHVLTYGLRLFTRPFGGFIIGLYADYKGRKNALILTSTITGLATSMHGIHAHLRPNRFDSHNPLFLHAVVTGLFFWRRESPTAISYLMEDAKENEKARIGGLLWGRQHALGIHVAFNLLCVDTNFKLQSNGWLRLAYSAIFRNHQLGNELLFQNAAHWIKGLCS